MVLRSTQIGAAYRPDFKLSLQNREFITIKHQVFFRPWTLDYDTKAPNKVDPRHVLLESANNVFSQTVRETSSQSVSRETIVESGEPIE
jgi:hypothetical protein